MDVGISVAVVFSNIDSSRVYTETETDFPLVAILNTVVNLEGAYLASSSDTTTLQP